LATLFYQTHGTLLVRGSQTSLCRFYALFILFLQHIQCPCALSQMRKLRGRAQSTLWK
jgi:hypothetical protein